MSSGKKDIRKNLQYQENQRFSGPNEESSSSNVQQVEHKKTKVFFGKRSRMSSGKEGNMSSGKKDVRKNLQ